VSTDCEGVNVGACGFSAFQFLPFFIIIDFLLLAPYTLTYFDNVSCSNYFDVSGFMLLIHYSYFFWCIKYISQGAGVEWRAFFLFFIFFFFLSKKVLWFVRLPS
jgi:hypothetical protein